MSYCGSVNLGGNLTFYLNTHNPSGGAATDATGSPSYEVYEEETGTSILTGSMSKLDDAGTTGFYSEQIACTTGNGFEQGKYYGIYIEATVSGVTGTSHRVFQVGAAVDVHWIDGNETAATYLRHAISTAIVGTCSTGSTTTVLETDLTGYANDRINTRTLYFLDGSSLEHEAAAITDYNETTGQITITATSSAAANTDQFIIL